MFRKHALITAVAALTAAGSASAALVTPTVITGFSGGDRYTPGNFTHLTDGVGITKGDANDPSTWTDSSTSYPHDWYDHYLTSGSNGQLGWLAVDLGSARSDLDLFYIFNANYAHNVPTQVAAKDVNVYYATAPGVALPSPPGSNGQVDYDLRGAGWTQLTSLTFTTGTETQTVDLSSITAQYIGFEIMTDIYSNDARVGFGEIAITAEDAPIPEPGSLALVGMGGLLIARRRRG